MCTPGRDTQNTEAPKASTWRLRVTDFVGLYFKVTTDPKYKRKKIRMQLNSKVRGVIILPKPLK